MLIRFSVFWSPAAVTPFATANLLNYNHEYSEELGLSPPLTTDWSEPIPGTTPYAHNYGGTPLDCAIFINFWKAISSDTGQDN